MAGVENALWERTTHSEVKKNSFQKCHEMCGVAEARVNVEGAGER